MPPAPGLMMHLRLLFTLALLAPTASAQCPDTLSLARDSVCATGAGDFLLVAGGTVMGTGDATVDLYNAASGMWSTSSLTASRGGASATSVGSTALIAGGGVYTPFGSYLAYDVVELFDATTSTWSTATLSLRRMFMAATSVSGRALFAGGISGGAPPFQPRMNVDIYDAGTGTWGTALLSQPRYLLSAASAGSFALFAGGHNGLTPVDVVDLYDANTGIWSVGQLSEARIWMGAASLGSRILFAGGARFDGATWVPSDVVDIYDTATGQWSVERLSVPRQQLAAASLGGAVLFAGGFDGVGPSDVVDVYDGARWSTLNLSQARYDLVGASQGAAALFAGGRIPTMPLETTVATVDLFPAGFPRRYCFGDGSGAACPCANPGAPGQGCANSTGAGARLEGHGCPSLAGDTLQLSATLLVPNQPVLLFAGLNAVQGGQGALFGDGLRCAGGAVQRLAIRSADANGTATWGPGLAAQAAWSVGDQRRLQAWYRDPTGPCGSAFNLSNGLELALAP